MHMTQLHGVAIRNVSGLLVVALALGAAPSLKHATAPVQITVKLSEWKVALSETTVPAGTVTFSITNAGSIPHGFEVEGRGIEKEIAVIQPGASDTLTLTLEPATYEVYCPVGEDSHKKLGMETHLKVLGAGSSGSSGYGESATGETHEARATVQSIRVTGGGPVIQILPGPFPFPDSAAPILKQFGDERRSEEHTSELQSPCNLVCRLLLEKKKTPPCHRAYRAGVL